MRTCMRRHNANPLSLATGSLAKPGNLMARLAERPIIWGPAVLYLLLMTACYLSTADLQVATEVELLRARGFDATAASLEPSVFRAWLLRLFNPLLVFALAVFLVGRLDVRVGSYRAMLSVVLWGEFVYAVGLLMAVPLAMRTGLGDFTFSVYTFLQLVLPGWPDGQSGSLLFLSKRADLFLILEVWLVGRGLAAVEGWSRRLAYAVALFAGCGLSLLWLVLLLVFEASG